MSSNISKHKKRKEIWEKNMLFEIHITMSIIFFASDFLRETMLFCPLFYDRKRASLFPTVTPSDRLFPSSTTNDKVTFPFPQKTEAEKTEKKLWQHNYCLLMRFAASAAGLFSLSLSSRRAIHHGSFSSHSLQIFYFFREANCRLICFLPSLPLPTH